MRNHHSRFGSNYQQVGKSRRQVGETRPEDDVRRDRASKRIYDFGELEGSGLLPNWVSTCSTPLR